MHILLLEDTIDIWESIKLYLESSNFVVDRATTIAVAKELLSNHDYNCTIVDRMLPDGNWTDFIWYIKKNYPHIPCILETAKFQIDDKLEWFDVWADDYLVKPYDLRELEIRVKKLIERYTQAIERVYNKIDIWDISINVDTMEIMSNTHLSEQTTPNGGQAQIIHCTANERIIIKMLCEDPNRVISRSELCEYIRWDEAQRMSENKLDVLISGIRKKLGKDSIETVKGVGYKLGNPNKE